MSELPKLTPVTRRVPPPGYVAPHYQDAYDSEGMADLLPYDREELEMADDRRLQEARRRAGYALYAYRWWGFTNIINTIRIWIQARRLR